MTMDNPDDFRNKRTTTCWAIRSDVGDYEYLNGEANGTTRTKLFRTRSEARAYNNKTYGYMRKPSHRYLRTDPFNWKMPKVVRVRVTIWED